jgi:hypothetical protein
METPPMFAPSSLAQWVSGIGTTLAVFVALFKDEVLRRIRRPKLSVRLSSEPPDCVLSPMDVIHHGMPVWRGDSYWLRLWVKNTGGFRAEQVQVFAEELWKRDARGRFLKVPDFIPMNLRWSNGRDPQTPEIFASGISREMGKHCDLCSISDPSNPPDELLGYKGQCVATLQYEVFPRSDRHRLPPGDYVLGLRIGAANAEPSKIFVRMNLTGTWSDDPMVMFRDFLGISIEPRLPQ